MGNAMYAQNMAQAAKQMDKNLQQHLNATYNHQIANKKQKEMSEREFEKMMAQRQFELEQKDERKTGAQRKSMFNKYKNDLKDSMQYSEYMKQMEKEKELEMDRAHRNYIDIEKEKQDKENDKYY